MIAASSAVLVAGVAAGFDLFLAIAAVATFSALDPGHGPPGAETLGSPLLFVPALAMAIVEMVAERRPHLDLVWRQAGAVMRPVGAAGLAALLTGSLTPRSRVGAAVVAGTIALSIQAARSGWTLLSRLRDERPPLGVGLVVEDLLVVVLVAGLWWAAPAALVGSGIVLVAVLARWPRWMAAFRLSGQLVRSHLLGLLVRRDWRSPVQFPAWMKSRLAPSGTVTGGRLRGTPAACIGHPDHYSVLWGWLLVRGPTPLFAHRSGRDVEQLRLEAGGAAPPRPGPLCLCVPLPSSGHPDLLLVVPDDGPEPEAVQAELRR